MERVYQILRGNPVVGMATVDANGNPQARAFEVANIEDGKIYFFTASGKKVFRQMKVNPNVAFTVTSPDYVSVRVSGKVVVTEDMELKTRILDMKPGIKELYKSADNPVLTLIYIEHGEAHIFDLSNVPPKQAHLTF